MLTIVGFTELVKNYEFLLDVGWLYIGTNFDLHPQKTSIPAAIILPKIKMTKFFAMKTMKPFWSRLSSRGSYLIG